MKNLKPELESEIAVRVLKYDGSESRRWLARLRERIDSLLILDAQFDAEVQHELLGTIERGTKTIEYYWLDRWYSVFQFLNDDGKPRLHYGNVNTPPQLKDNVLTYIDLDIDIMVSPELNYRILDLDEFECNAALYGYPDEMQVRARQATDELISLIEARGFPFSDSSRIR
jgi:uncharacterized protein